jgi:hypothetical protein
MGDASGWEDAVPRRAALALGKGEPREDSAVEWRVLGELRWKGWKTGSGALVQCREGMVASQASGERSGSAAVVEHATPA